MFSERLIAFCLAGHCDTSKKTQQAIDIIKFIKEKYPDELLSYCSHVPIDPCIQELTHYSYYDSHNIISNLDYKDNLSSRYKQIFWHVPLQGYCLIKTVPHQCYAHHTNWYVQSKILVDKKLDHIFYLNTDCDYKIFDMIDQHIQLHREGFDAVFYNFFVGEEEINGEFFSMTKKGMEEIVLSMTTQSDFYSYGTWSFEQCYFRAARHNNVNRKFLGVWAHGEDGVIGNNLFGEIEQNEEVRILNAINSSCYVIPYIDYLDGYVLKIACMCQGVLEMDSTNIKLVFWNDSNVDSDFSVVDFNLYTNSYNICVPPRDFPIVKVYRDEKFVLAFDLRDKRNIGDMVLEADLPDTNKNLKG
jgi:hypothetical protein